MQERKERGELRIARPVFSRKRMKMMICHLSASASQLQKRTQETYRRAHKEREGKLLLTQSLSSLMSRMKLIQ
jgi:hypothetical protein